MKLIVLLAALAFSQGEKLDKTYLPPNAQSSGGSGDVLLTPNTGTAVLGDNAALQGQVVESFIPGAGANSRLLDDVIDPNRQSSDVVSIGNRGNIFPNPGQYQGGSNSGQFQVVEQRPERAQAALERNAAILRQDNRIDGDGTFAYAYETENGIYGEENGIAANGIMAQGAYSYVGDDGVQYSISYTADENGFRPQGDHLPTPPPVPEEIQRALEQNARDEAAGIYDDGSYDDRKYGGSGTQGLGIINVVPNDQYGTPDGVNTDLEDAVVISSARSPKLLGSGFRSPVLVSSNNDVSPSAVNIAYLPPVGRASRRVSRSGRVAFLRSNR